MTTFLVKNKLICRVFVCICAYLCVFSFGKIIELHGSNVVFWGGKYFGYNLASVVLFGVTVWLFYRFLFLTDKRLKLISLAGGGLLSCAIVYGAYVHYVNDIFISAGETFLQLGMILAINVLCAPLVAQALLLTESCSKCFATVNEQGNSAGTHNKYLTKLKVYFSKHNGMYFFFVWSTIFLCYIPIFLAYWPGNFIFDAKYQMASVIVDSISTHHPLIHTLMMGKAYQFGEYIGNVSVGYQFYTIAQMLILTASFAYTLTFLYKKQVKSVFLYILWAYFALFPMHHLFAITATKDVLCAAFFLFFMVFFAKYLFDRENFGAWSYVGMIVSGIFLALFRNNALYAVLVAAVFILIFTKGWKEKSKLLLVFIAIVIFSKMINSGLIAYANAWEGNTYTETLSLPLQCLGRVVDYRGEELKEIAPDMYEEISHYISEECWESYNPYNSDAIKSGANEALLRSNTINFLKLWIKVALRFPDEYIEAVITNTMGYWYPLNQGYYVSMDIALYHTLIGLGEELDKRSFCPIVNVIYDPLFYNEEYRQVPLLGFLFRNMPYIWTQVLYMLYSFYKKEKNMLLLGILPVVYVATCFCGPLVALRYIYCIIVCTPLLFGVMLAFGKKRIE